MYRALCRLRALLEFLHPCLLAAYIFFIFFFTGLFFTAFYKHDVVLFCVTLPHL